MYMLYHVFFWDSLLTILYVYMISLVVCTQQNNAKLIYFSFIKYEGDYNWDY